MSEETNITAAKWGRDSEIGWLGLFMRDFDTEIYRTNISSFRLKKQIWASTKSQGYTARKAENNLCLLCLLLESDQRNFVSLCSCAFYLGLFLQQPFRRSRRLPAVFMPFDLKVHEKKNILESTHNTSHTLLSGKRNELVERFGYGS